MKRPILVGCFHIFALGSLFLCTGGRARSEPLPLPHDLQTQVNNAIDKGVLYLTKMQQATGTWVEDKKGNEVGNAALPALTMLECGVPPGDLAILKAAIYVRNNCAKLDGTYEIALSILFLDRLGNPNDKQLIQKLAMRLIAGQTLTGGWGYKCPVPNAEQHGRILALLRKLEPPLLENLLAVQQPGMPNMIPGQGGLGGGILGKDGKFDNPLGKGGDKTGQIITGKSPGDLSTGSLKDAKDSKDPKGLMLDVPLERVNIQTWDRPPFKFPSVGVRSGLCLKAEEAPNPDFIPKRLTQKAKPPIKIPAEFGAIPVLQPVEKVPLVEMKGDKTPLMWGRTDNSNTQFAILALWAARRHDIPAERSMGLVLRRFTTSQEKSGGWGYEYKFSGGAGETPAMTSVGLLGMAVGHGLAKEMDGPVRDIVANDPRILNGFVQLSHSIGQPTGKWNNLPMQNLYYLWALERVSVLYNLPTIGGRNWYQWSAESLVANQHQEFGNWDKGGYPGASPVLDTCFALLVLKRANFAKDLAANLPFDPVKLNQQIADRIGGNLIEKKTESPPPTPPVVTPKPEPMPLPTPITKDPEPTPGPTPVVTPAAQPKTTVPVVTPEEPRGIPWWIWAIVGVGLLILVLGAIYMLTNRGGSDEDMDDEDDEERPRKRKRAIHDDEDDEPRPKRKRKRARG